MKWKLPRPIAKRLLMATVICAPVVGMTARAPKSETRPPQQSAPVKAKAKPACVKPLTP